MKKNLTGRGLFIFAIFALALYSLYPTYRVHSLKGDAKTTFKKEHPKMKAINFGLDLAGGTNIVVEIDKSNLKPDEAVDALDRSLEIVRNRVDQYGLSEPNITPSGDNRIVADLAGVDAERARGLIGETALLEFKLVVEPEKFAGVLTSIDESLKKRTSSIATKVDSASMDSTVTDSNLAVNSEEAKVDSVAQAEANAEKALNLLGAATSIEVDSTKSDSAKTVKADSVVKDSTVSTVASSVEELKELPFSSLLIRYGSDIAVAQKNIPRIKKILAMSTVQALIPRDMEFVWGRGFEELENGNKVKTLYGLRRHAEMDGKEISTASYHQISDGMQVGQMAVNLKFKGIGPKKFATITGNNLNRQMAIVLDNQVISAPVIRARIADGNAQITGLDDAAEAKQLAIVLRAGALPAPMKIIELRSVGATLGEDNIASGINALLLGLALVILFMVIYYLASGTIAVMALVFNIILIIAVMSERQATLTLPGIAGIILTIGMAVDANVIIFERIREELALGKTARTAIGSGYEKAYSTILDANITTFLTAFILYKIGSGPIKGFGLTLMIGIAASLFTALTVTRFIFDLMLKKNASTSMSIGKGFKVLNEASFKIIEKSKPFIMFSAVLIAVAIILLPTKGLNFGIDFTGGHVLTVQFEDEANTKDVRAALEIPGLKSPTVRTLSEDNRFLISLQDGGDEAIVVKEKVRKAFASKNMKYEVINEDIVGPSIGSELREDAMLAVFWSLIIIIGYIWVRFGKYGLGFGVGSVVALAHDVIITLGIFSLFGLDVDAAIIAAILTIVGYSLNDTIVVYDRIRENTELLGKETYQERVNLSINQSLSRTFITSLTTLLVVVVLWIFGGSSIKDFAIAMTIGVVVGTYSSVFIATPFVVWWEKRFGFKSKRK